MVELQLLLQQLLFYFTVDWQRVSAAVTVSWASVSFFFFFFFALIQAPSRKRSLCLPHKHKVVKKGARFHTDMCLFDTRSKTEVMNGAV